jgi:hypothetical protein
LTSPAYINSSIDCRWLYGTSFKIMIGCFDGFSYQAKTTKSNPLQCFSYFTFINITTNYCNKYKIQDFSNLGRDTAFTGQCFARFRRNIQPLPSRVKTPTKNVGTHRHKTFMK